MLNVDQYYYFYMVNINKKQLSVYNDNNGSYWSGVKLACSTTKLSQCIPKKSDLSNTARIFTIVT